MAFDASFRPTLRVSLGLCLLLPILFAKQLPAQTPATRKIGVTVGLTGNLASIGAGIRNAILLAKKENDPANSVEFLFEDDGFDAKRTVSAVLKFIDQDKVDGLIVFGSGNALAVNDIAERNKIPLIALGNSKRVIAGKNYVMMHFLNTDIENAAVVRYVKQLPFTRIAVICSSHEAMLDLGSAFKAALPNRVALSLEVLPAATDFRSEINRIKASNTDAVYNVLLPGAASLFAKQLRQLGYQGELFSAHAVDDWNEVKNSQGALVGTWFVTGNVVTDGGFAGRYQAAFGDSPKVATPNGYDAAKLYILASKAPDMNTYLHQVKDFHGIMGTYGLHPDGYFELSAALRRVTETGFVPLR